MGSPGSRRADSAERLFRFRFALLARCLSSDVSRVLRLGCLILILAAPAPGSADEVVDDTAAEETDDEAPDTGEPVRSVGEVSITATRAERDVLDVAGNVTIVEREEIRRSGADTVGDLLRRQPGLFATNSTTNPAGFNIDARGFNNGGGNGTNMLVQVDGRRVNEPDGDFPDWALIPLDEIQSIEIVRGPSSAIYGDTAIGGVVNIRTLPREGPPRVTLRGRVGRYDTGGGSFDAAGTLGSVTGSLFIDGVTTDGYRDNSAFDSQDYKASLEWNLRDRVLMGIRGGYHEDSREFPGPLTQEAIDEFGRRAAAPDNAGDGSEVQSGFVHGWVQALLAEDVELRIQPYYRPRSDEATFSSLAFGDTAVDADKESIGVDAQLRIDRPLFGRPNRLIIGGEFLHESVDGSSNSPDFFGLCSQERTTTVTDKERDIYAVFLQEELHVTDELLVSAGVRFDRATLDLFAVNDDPGCGGQASRHPDYSIWSPKASVTYRVHPTTSLYVSYARGFRIPSLDEAAPVVFPGFIQLPDLDAQVSDAGEIGVKLRSGRVDASLSLYLMWVHDEILFDPATFENENLDLVRHGGIEASVNVQIVSWLWGYANYSFDDVKILEADEPLLDGARMPITPRHRGSLGLFAKLPYDLEFTANANFVDARILANDFDRQLPKLDDYATLDLLMAWRPEFGDHVEGALTMALRNVAGEKFDDFGARFDTPDEGPTAFFSPAARRTWEVGFMLTFRR